MTPIRRCTRWFQLILILPVGESVNSSVSVAICRHFLEIFLFTWGNLCVEALLETRILYFIILMLWRMIELWARGVCSHE
jgi:hypothetical protein